MRFRPLTFDENDKNEYPYDFDMDEVEELINNEIVSDGRLSLGLQPRPKANELKKLHSQKYDNFFLEAF